MVKTNEDIGDQSIQYDSAMTFSDNMKQLRKLIMRSFRTHIQHRIIINLSQMQSVVIVEINVQVIQTQNRARGRI